MKTTLQEIIKDLNNNYDFDVYNNIDFEELSAMDSLEDALDYIEELNEDYAITDEDVIYYASAMEYLKENDPSLRESLEIARDYGYELENLNSETLASLLKSKNNLEDFEEFLEELREKLDELFNS